MRKGNRLIGVILAMTLLMGLAAMLQDYVILAEYIKSFAKDGDYSKVNTTNSPLAAYEGYLLNYEEPTGAGRIQIMVQ